MLDILEFQGKCRSEGTVVVVEGDVGSVRSGYATRTSPASSTMQATIPVGVPLTARNMIISEGVIGIAYRISRDKKAGHEEDKVVQI